MSAEMPDAIGVRARRHGVAFRADRYVKTLIRSQVAIAAFSFGIGFIGLATVFRIRSFKEVIRRGREDRAADRAAAAGAAPG